MPCQEISSGPEVLRGPDPGQMAHLSLDRESGQVEVQLEGLRFKFPFICQEGSFLNKWLPPSHLDDARLLFENISCV